MERGRGERRGEEGRARKAIATHTKKSSFLTVMIGKSVRNWIGKVAERESSWNKVAEKDE